MCRNIKTLFNFEPPVTDEEIRAASLQFVRKISGFNKPSKANEAVFLGPSIKSPASPVVFCAHSQPARPRGTAKPKPRGQSFVLSRDSGREKSSVAVWRFAVIPSSPRRLRGRVRISEAKRSTPPSLRGLFERTPRRILPSRDSLRFAAKRYLTQADSLPNLSGCARGYFSLTILPLARARSAYMYIADTQLICIFSATAKNQ